MLDLPLFPVEERSVSEVLDGIGSFTICVNEPPWSSIAPELPVPARVVEAWEMDINHLEALAAVEPDSGVVVGLGGGSALDTAKFIAWKTGKRLIQIPTITSVDAGFTDAVGVRVGQKVKYVGDIVPDTIIIDLALIRSAPKRLNRAGIGDILSCHTGLADWRIATARSEGVPWDEGLAELGETLLEELAIHTDEIRAVTKVGVRWIVSAYRRIGAGCRLAGHSRFEEGSEHFLAYAYEYLTGVHQVHGELIAMCVVAMSTLHDDSEVPARVVKESGVRANPVDLGIDRKAFSRAMESLPAYVCREELDFSAIDILNIDQAVTDRAWSAIESLPREEH